MQVLYDVRLGESHRPQAMRYHLRRWDEALVADGIGQPSSPEIYVQNRGAHAVTEAEGKTGERVSQVLDWTSRGPRTWHVSTSFIWESGELCLRPIMVRIGKELTPSR